MAGARDRPESAGCARPAGQGRSARAAMSGRLVYGHSVRALSVKGYNDKQHILLKKIMEKMTRFQIDEKRFDIIKEA
ncbi:hypothetical protein CRUP_023531, partial [Coryphaenoides rupestris]